MAMLNNNIRMESLFYSINELKHEKLCLVQKLQEQRAQRQTLEQDLEQVISRLSQSEEKQRRFSETIAIALQKVTEVQNSIHTIEEKIGRNRPGRNCIQRAMDEVKDYRRDSLVEFQSCLSAIASSLFTKKDFYKEKVLENNIVSMETQCKDLENKMEEFLKARQSLTLRLNKLTAEGNACQPDIEMEQLIRTVICALENDKQEMYDYLQRLKAELQSVHDALKNAQTSA